MATEEKDEDIKLEERPDGTVVVNPEPKPAAAAPEDEKLTSNNDEEHDPEEQGHAEETSEEAEARRQRNRERRAQNKEARKNYIESLKRELASRDAVINDLSTRVASVEQRSVGAQLSQVDAALKEAEQFYNHYRDINRKAIEMADGAAAVDAQEKMFAAQQRYQMLQGAKKQMSQQPTKPTPLDPRLKQHADEWTSRNTWYDPSGQDLDSDLVLKLDDRLIKEGWNPTTSEYWEELDARVKKYLPHRANLRHNSGTGDSTPRRSSPVAAGGVAASTGKSGGEYILSPERVQALKDAGMWDDPAKRAAMIRRYQSQDKEQRA